MSEPVPFWCFYECFKCKRHHKGNEQTPDSAVMIPGTRPNEFVFRCEPTCDKPE